MQKLSKPMKWLLVVLAVLLIIPIIKLIFLLVKIAITVIIALAVAALLYGAWVLFNKIYKTKYPK